MKAASPRGHWRGELALTGVTLIWGSTFVVVKQALDDVSTLLFLALRFGLASLVLVIAFRRQIASLAGDTRAPGDNPSRWRRLGWIGRAEAVRGGLLAGLFLFGGYVFQTFGLKHTTASKSAFLTGLAIVLVPVLAALIYRKAPLPSEAAGVGLATAGMALLTLEGNSLRMGLGDFLTLLCAFCFALHILVVGFYSRRTGFEILSVTQIFTAGMAAALTCWWVEVPRVAWSEGVVFAVLVTGLLATALAFTVQAWAQQHTTATRTALIFALEPVFAWITSFLVAGEVLAARAAGGAALILAGIVLVELKPALKRGRTPA